MSDFRKELENLINRNSKENGSDTPDWILSEYLTSCLAAFDLAVRQREKWYGREQPVAACLDEPRKESTNE